MKAKQGTKTSGTTGDHIVAHLLANGVDTVFGLPGVQTYPIFDALARNSDRIRTITARHEQATALMALGYAQSTGRAGVYSVVPGPGVLNTGAALCTAFGLNAPVLCLTGQVPSEFLGRGRGHLHEIPDQAATLSSFIKAAYRIEHPQDAMRTMAEAWRTMTTGRPGPVSVETCWNTLAAPADLPLPHARGDRETSSVDPEAIARAAEKLAGAKHPMIMVGGGARHAGDAVLALAEALSAPVV